MPRPRTVQKRLLERFAQSPLESLSIVDLLRDLPEYQSTQLAHGLLALSSAEELIKDGKRRNVTLPCGRVTRLQHYKLAPSLVLELTRADAAVCASLGIDQTRASEMPFRVTENTVAYLTIQQALVGGPRRVEMARAIRMRYGAGSHQDAAAPMPAQLSLPL